MKRLIMLTGAAVLAASGCSSDPNDVSYSAIIHDLSPELQGSVERPIDINRNMNLVSDFDGRMFWDDLGRAFYTDRATRLSPMPVGSFAKNPQ